MTLPFEGFQEERLIGLNDAAFMGVMGGLMPGDLLQESVAPQKRGVFVDLALLGGRAYAHAINQRLRIP